MCDSEELEWELFELFETGLFAFPIYEHRSARRIVRYLLTRGVCDEEIADAIEDSCADLHVWLNHHGKNMVGEWVIAWMNDCRDEYEKEHAMELERNGYVGAYADVTPELSYNSDEDTSDDDDMPRGVRRAPLIRQTTASTVELASRASTSNELSHQGSLDTELEYADDSAGLEDQYREIPTITITNSKNGGTFPITDSDEGNFKLRRGEKNRSFNKDHFREVVRYGTREKLKKLTTKSVKNGELQEPEINGNSDDSSSVSHEADNNENFDFPPPPPPPADDLDIYSKKFAERIDQIVVSINNIKSMEAVELPKCENCQCTIPHYVFKFTPRISDLDKLDMEYLELQRMDSADSLIDMNVSDNTLRAMEVNIDTLEQDGPGYVYIMSDIHDCLPWSEDHQYKIASSRNPERCLNEFRSRNLNIDLIWQKKVEHHLRAIKEVHDTLRMYKLHTNWFRCSLSIIMKTVSVVVKQYNTGLRKCLI